MKRHFFYILLNSIVLLIFIAMMPFIIAQQQNESDYYNPFIQDSKNETASQINKLDNLTVVPTVSFAGELIGQNGILDN